jgi:hypothetical protein
MSNYRPTARSRPVSFGRRHEGMISRGAGVVSGVAGAGVAAVLGAVLAAVLIMSQMSGCCGTAPTHGCAFVETVDASAKDSSGDATIGCPFAPCVPGVTTCCVQPQSEPPVSCIPVTQVCPGFSGNCGSDTDCPAGAGQHCCGTTATMQIQCQSDCSGNFDIDGTIRICRTNDECPPDRPTCGSIGLGGHTIYACVPMSSN